MKTRWIKGIRDERAGLARRKRTTTVTSALFSFLFVITAGNPVQAADPASRFLNITAWTGNFRRTAHDVGNRRHDTDCNTQWTINHSVDITTRMPLDPGTINIPNFRLWGDAGNHTESVKIDEDTTETCVNSEGNIVIFRWIARTDPSHSPEGFELVIDTQAGTYTIGFGTGTDILTANTFVVDGTPIMSGGSVKFSPEVTFTNPLPASGFLAQWNPQVPLEQLRLPLFLLALGGPLPYCRCGSELVARTSRF